MPPETLIRGTSHEPANLSGAPPLDAYLEGNGGPAVELAPDADLASVQPHLGALKTITVHFPAFTDGRGFSIARQLRRLGYEGDLIARGHLVPEQHLLARDTGFDAVAVPTELFERHTAKAWADALSDFPAAYQRNSRSRVSIPDRRSNMPDPFDRLVAETRAHIRRAVARYGSGLGMVSSFGADSAVLLHLVSQEAPDLPIYFIDTGKHFAETLAYRDDLTSRFGLTNVTTLAPESRDWDNQHLADPDGCCAARKVAPMKGVAHLAARITGRKRYQTPDRATMQVFESGEGQDTVNPLAFWKSKDITRYIRQHDLPPHPLLAKGYLSIGCAPCTTPVREGESERAGRWRDMAKEECGIHLVDGRWQPETRARTFEVF